jgi:hypothetical protein
VWLWFAGVALIIDVSDVGQRSVTGLLVKATVDPTAMHAG